MVSVLVKSKDGKVKFDKDDERMSVKAYEAAKKQAFEKVQQQPAGSPSPAPEARLAQLTALHDSGLITAEEYAQQRHRRLDEI